MDRVEQMLLRMTELQPQIPFWAKAEQMEICTPQKELWKYTDDALRTKKRDFLYAIVHCRVAYAVILISSATDKMRSGDYCGFRRVFIGRGDVCLPESFLFRKSRA